MIVKIFSLLMTISLSLASPRVTSSLNALDITNQIRYPADVVLNLFIDKVGPFIIDHQIIPSSVV